MPQDQLIAVLCPGQGAQAPGFLTDWLADDDFREAFTPLDAATGLDLATHGTVSDAATIRDTAVAQPLIVAASLAAAQVVAKRYAVGNLVVTGHSVGELAAVALAGVLTPAEAMRLVTVRGRAMAGAAALEPTGMSAVIGGDLDTVSAALAEHGLTAANVNGAGQVVAAGSLERLTALGEAPPAGARVRRLQVAGAFHTTYMAPALEELRAAAAALTPSDPTCRLLSNADGASVTSGRDALDRLVAQVSRQVRWDLCMRALAGLGVSVIIELPPAGALTGLVKREIPDVPRVALKTPGDLAALEPLLAHR